MIRGFWIQAESTADEAPSSQVTEDTQLMLRIQLRSMFHISCSAMSSCGSFIAASALDGVRVFRLEVLLIYVPTHG